MAKKKKEIEDILIRQKEDRRLLSHVPDTSGLRTNQDRRSQNGHGGNHDFSDIIASDAAGRRYAVEYDVTVYRQGKVTHARGIDVSTTGMLLRFDPSEELDDAGEGESMKISFQITPGSMPEGYEMKIKKMPVRCVRTFRRDGDDGLFAAFNLPIACRNTLIRKKAGIAWPLLRVFFLSSYSPSSSCGQNRSFISGLINICICIVLLRLLCYCRGISLVRFTDPSQSIPLIRQV